MNKQQLIFLSLLVTGTACHQPLPPSTSSVKAYELEAGRYTIKSVNSGLCLDIPSGNIAPGVVLAQWTCNGSNAQIFELRNAGDAYVITAGSQALDIQGPSKERGAILQLWNRTNSANQQFRLERADHDEFVLRSVHSDLVLDVDKISKEPGAKILQWSATGGANQRWIFTRVNEPKDKEWKLVWADEFEGKELDRNRWKFDIKKPGWVNHELQNYVDRPENTRVENGHLVIEARKDNFDGEKFSSGRINTEGKASWTYGRFEARMQLPKGVGTWPAFWMMPDDQSRGWPACGEIDIMEHVGYDQNWINATTHSNDYSWRSNTQRTAKTEVPGVSEGYHVYSVEWYPDRIDAFVDGRKYYTSPNDNKGDNAYPFTKNFHIILNLAVGGDWGGIKGVDENIWPQQLLVDYVRVYQQK